MGNMAPSPFFAIDGVPKLTIVRLPALRGNAMTCIRTTGPKQFCLTNINSLFWLNFSRKLGSDVPVLT
jgi:hypothetical protein